LRRVERESRADGSAVAIVSVNQAAHGEESPSCRVGRAVHARRSGLEEVHEVDRYTLHGAGEDDEELKHNTASDEDESQQAEDGSSSRHRSEVARDEVEGW